MEELLKTNVTRLLDAKKIIYKAHLLPAEKFGAQETSVLLNVPLERIFKTIVAVRQRPGKVVLAVIPGHHQLDLKLLAEFVHEKKMMLPTEKEAENLTGLQAGGISPLALVNKGFQVIIESTANNFESIHVSGGKRGLNLELKASDLANLTGARFANISSLTRPGTG